MGFIDWWTPAVLDRQSLSDLCCTQQYCHGENTILYVWQLCTVYWEFFMLGITISFDESTKILKASSTEAASFDFVVDESKVYAI